MLPGLSDPVDRHSGQRACRGSRRSRRSFGSATSSRASATTSKSAGSRRHGAGASRRRSVLCVATISRSSSARTGVRGHLDQRLGGRRGHALRGPEGSRGRHPPVADKLRVGRAGDERGRSRRTQAEVRHVDRSTCRRRPVGGGLAGVLAKLRPPLSFARCSLHLRGIGIELGTVCRLSDNPHGGAWRASD